MAAYRLNADEVLDWTPRKLRALREARMERQREQRLWDISVARIPSLADPAEYIDELIAGLMPWEEYTAATGAPRLDQMTDGELAKLGIRVDGADEEP